MLYVVHFNSHRGVPIVVGVFLMHSDAEQFVKNTPFNEDFVISQTNAKAWEAWKQIKECMEDV